MFKKSVLLIIIFLLAAEGLSFAQTKNYSKSFKEMKKHEWFKWKWHWHNGDPFLELNYGIGEPKQKEFSSGFSKIGLAEIKLGFNSSEETDNENILEIDEKFFFGSKISTDLNSSGNDTPDKQKTNLLRLGVAKRTGYGYELGAISIFPYNERGFVWSQLKINKADYPERLIPPYMSYFPPELLADSYILDRYNKQTRFGTISEGGIRLNFASAVSFNAAYEADVIFPRHLFWKQAASYILEDLGSHSIDYFVEDVLDSSPAAAPIVSFLLKNAYSYGWYLLKKEKMNWPFETEAPLTYETFKVGVTFTF